MIRYDRLWATMEARGMTQYRLIKQYSFSAGQIGRLKKNMHVSTHTLDTLCSILECDISDIIEYVPDELPQPEEVPAGQSADTPDDRDQAEGPGQEGDYGQGEDSSQEDTPPAKQKRSDPAKGDKPEAAKNDKPKKAGKSKKGEKGDKKSSKDGKKGKDSKKNK